VAYRFGEIKKYTKSIFTVLHRREENLEGSVAKFEKGINQLMNE
jgi:hypothetical protein